MGAARGEAVLAARAGGERPLALTLTWAEARGSTADEEPLARATAARLGLRHVVREISGEEVRDQLPAILAVMDQPSIDGFNTWLVARLAREESTSECVALGLASASAGKSHSWLTATTRSPRPSPKRISVPLEMSEAIRPGACMGKAER